MSPSLDRLARALPAAASLAVALACASPLPAQAVKGGPADIAVAPPVRFHDFVPGLTPMADVTAALGEPAHANEWYAWKLLWPAKGADGLFDAFHVNGSPANGKLANIEAVTIPAGFETEARILEKLGAPEIRVVFPGGQRLLDYSRLGARFTLDAQGRAIGVALFPHGYTRVHEGCRREVDLSHLRQGPQPRPEKPAPPELLCGASEVEIVPEPGWLRGEFTVRDPLKARIAVFARGELRVAVVGADLFGMMKSEVDPIEARLREKGVDHLFFAMSHNHAAPDTIGIYGFFPDKFVAHLQDRVVAGVEAALARLEPVKELLVSADDLSLAGARVHGLFRNARNPGIVDPQLAVVQARGAKGAIVTLVQFACHVEGLEAGEKEMSADFPGYLCEQLRETTGAQAIFLNGALGGMVSGDSLARTHEEARTTGLHLAREAERILAFAVPSTTNRFAFERARIECPVTNPKMLLFEKMSGGRRPYLRGRVVSEIFHFTLGDAEIVSMPGELLPEASFEILEKMSGYPRMIVGLVNDELGYMIPPHDFRAGTYEEGMSVSPAIAPVVQESAIRLIESARAQ